MRSTPRQDRSDNDDEPEPRRLEDSVQPVVRRRRIRAEWLVLVVGIVFVLSAVAKPWGGTQPIIRGTSPTTTPAAIAIASPSAVDSASPEPVEFMGIPGMPRAAPNGHGRTWADVRWNVLQKIDTHAALGLSTVGLTVVPYSGPYLPNPPSPQVTWSPASRDGAATTVSIPADTHVFAIAATWPTSLQVTGISISYLIVGGQPYQPASSPVVPIAAGSVVLGQPTQASPSSSRSTINSGQFWVAPSAYSPDLDPGTLALVWQLGPWAWPNGQYSITLVAPTGPVVMRLVLEQGAG
jgi:hypothetical protein